MTDDTRAAKECNWHLDDVSDDETWDTSCQRGFRFDEGGPVANGFKVCPYCALPITESRSSTETDE